MPYLNTDRVRYADYFDWYEGRLDSLFQVARTQVNGLLNVAPEELTTRFNYFAAVSRFYADAMSGDVPNIPSDIADLLDSLTEHWAVTGECCLVRVNGRWNAVRPDYVFPQLNKYDRAIVDSFLFVFPERRPAYQHGDRDNRITYADSARVISYDVQTGQALASQRRYRHGWVADVPAGVPVNVGPVLWVDTGDGCYQDIDGIVREITIRLNIMQSTLNSSAFSLLQIDKDSVADGTLLTGVTPARVHAAARSGMGLTVSPPFIGEEGARFIERTGGALEESLGYLRLLLGQLGVLSGVPDYVFGVQLGRPADENERVLFAGQAKVNRFRRHIEAAFTLAGVQIRFATEPFVTRTQRVASILEQYEKGVTTLAETRAALGRNPNVVIPRPAAQPAIQGA